ncbi:MAG TPA: hypothetical protein VGF86_12965 [Candidatus Tumulicola sp.]
MLSLDVEPHVRDALRERAASAGVSMAEYLSNALAEPERDYATGPLEIAQPLTQISYRIAQAAQALARNDAAAVAEELAVARRIVAEAMAPLRRRHAEEARANDPRPATEATRGAFGCPRILQRFVRWGHFFGEHRDAGLRRSRGRSRF